MIFAGYGALAVALTVLSLEPPYATPLWPMLLLTIAGFAVLAIRHRYPRFAFAATLVVSVASLTAGSGAESVLVLIALYTAGVRWRAARAWLCFGGAMLAGALGALALLTRGTLGPPILGLAPPLEPRHTVQDWANLYLVIAVVLLIATLFGTNAGHRRRHIDELVHRAEQLARERDQQAEVAKARERERISREMHDVIAHSLSVMIAMSDGAYAASGARPREAQEAIARVAETGRKTLGEVRRLLGSVRTHDHSPLVEHAPQPDASQLATLAQEFVSAGLPVQLAVRGEPSSDRALGLTVYRIVQESLTNVLRHAKDSTGVSVMVTWSAAEVTVTVHDRSSLAAVSATPGAGLLGMQERVALYHGELETGPDPSGGWRVFARLRCEEA